MLLIEKFHTGMLFVEICYQGKLFIELLFVEQLGNGRCGSTPDVEQKVLPANLFDGVRQRSTIEIGRTF
jgi:hypothetical protein